LVVDDFGVRYGKQSDADHLIATLRANDYELAIKETGDTALPGNEYLLRPWHSQPIHARLH
jgi:hypothetical protein